MTEIKTIEEPSQTNGLGSNLGGPIPNYLDSEQKALNVQWAQKFEKLNGGGPL